MQTMDTIERVVSADSASPNEDNIDRALRPTLLKDYVAKKPSAISCRFSLLPRKSVMSPWTTSSCSDRPGSGKRRLRTSLPTKWA